MDQVAERPPWLLRVKAADGGVVGAGVLVGDEIAMTCAHVVNHAVGRAPTDVARPDGEILLDVPFSESRITCTASVEEHGWEPISDLGEGDVAILRLSDSAPSDAMKVPWKSFRSVWGHPFRAYGFPPGNDRGEWTRGELMGPVGRDWVQLLSRS